MDYYNEIKELRKDIKWMKIIIAVISWLLAASILSNLLLFR